MDKILSNRNEKWVQGVQYGLGMDKNEKTNHACAQLCDRVVLFTGTGTLQYYKNFEVPATIVNKEPDRLVHRLSITYKRTGVPLY